MFLLLNSLVASLDGLLIGIGLRLAKSKLSTTNILSIFIGNMMIYTFFLLLYYYFKLSFMTKTISTILYLFLAWRALKEDEKANYQKKLTLLECCLLTLTHSLDGTIISLNFVYNYPLFEIIALFSFMSVAVLYIGYTFATLFSGIKKANILSALLFILLAIINQFL